MLFKFMENNSDLAKGIVDGANGRDKKNKLWEKISKSLNDNGPPTRTTNQWKKVIIFLIFFLLLLLHICCYLYSVGLELPQIQD